MRPDKSYLDAFLMEGKKWTTKKADYKARKAAAEYEGDVPPEIQDLCDDMFDTSIHCIRVFFSPA